MVNVVLPSTQFNEIDYEAIPGYARDEAASRSKEDPNSWFEFDQTGFMDLFSSVFDQQYLLDYSKSKPIGNIPPQNDVSADAWTPQPPPTENPSSHPLTSWEILKNYGKGSRSKAAIENSTATIGNSTVTGKEKESQRLSMEEILMIAGEKFIQFSTNRIDGVSMFIHPYSSSSLSDLSPDDSRDIELLHFLLAAVDYVGLRQFDLASKLLSRCLWIASDSGTTAQRVAFYFAQALQAKVCKESGVPNFVNENRKQEEKEALALCTNNAFLASHQELPFAQVVQFAGIEAILENVKDSRSIHLIDLQIRSGITWTALMQGLSERSITRLKITAVGTREQSYIKETGKRLDGFAKSLNLPFLFEIVYLTDMTEFNENLFSIEADETVVVYSFMMLRVMISKPHSLENLMGAITRMKPAIMVVIEVEANHNSPSFVDRFTESLLFYSAYFDCLDECMDRESEYRRVLEGTYFGGGIMNIVAAEDGERVTRNVRLDVWRAFLRRFGMVEVELSESAKYQASLVLNRFPKGSSCNLEWDGKGLIVGWKGTPLKSLTVWKFL